MKQLGAPLEGAAPAGGFVVCGAPAVSATTTQKNAEKKRKDKDSGGFERAQTFAPRVGPPPGGR